MSCERFDPEDWTPEEIAAVAAHIEIGFAQAERGELIDGDVALAMLRQRRANRVKLEQME